MRLALSEASKAKKNTEPNPAVGCVIVNKDRIVAKAFHAKFGGPHAEVLALNKARDKAKGAILYVTLEPCCHFGKTPPCTERIIKSGIKTVVAAIADPNPANSGKGFKILRKNGIKVISGVLGEEAARLNKEFIERMKRKRPFITVKIAQSLDGKIATKTGDSKWISSSSSRRLANKLRSKNDAIMVGINTILKDDPRLTIRNSNGKARIAQKQPTKIVVDSLLKTPPDARIFTNSSIGKVIIATTKIAPKANERLLKEKGAEILCISKDQNSINLKDLMRELAKRGIANILVEGGGELIASLFEERLVDKLNLFIAPIIIGGRDAITSVEGSGSEMVKEALRLNKVEVKKIGRDLLLEA